MTGAGHTGHRRGLPKEIVRADVETSCNIKLQEVIRSARRASGGRGISAGGAPGMAG